MEENQDKKTLRDRIEDKYQKRRSRTEKYQLADRLARSLADIGAGVAVGKAGVPVQKLEPSFQADWAGRLGDLDKAEAAELKEASKPTLEDRIKEATAIAKAKKTGEGDKKSIDDPNSEVSRAARAELFRKRPDLSSNPDFQQLTANEVKLFKGSELSDSDKKSLMYGARSERANTEYEDLVRGGADPETYAVYIDEHLPKFLADRLTNEEEKALAASKSAFIAGILRKDTGAAVTDREFRLYNQMYFPVPEESDRTNEFKSILRQEAVDTMKFLGKQMNPAEYEKKMEELTRRHRKILGSEKKKEEQEAKADAIEFLKGVKTREELESEDGKVAIAILEAQGENPANYVVEHLQKIAKTPEEKTTLELLGDWIRRNLGSDKEVRQIDFNPGRKL